MSKLQTTRRGRTTLISIMSLALAIGCGGSDTTAPTTELGTYALVNVNGQAVPYTLAGTSSGTVVIQSGSITLAAVGTALQYTAIVSGTANGIGPMVLATDGGTYTRSGSSLSFTSVLGVQYGGTLSGSDLTISLPGALFGTTSTITILLRRP
jgi:hypothetical protein